MACGWGPKSEAGAGCREHQGGQGRSSAFIPNTRGEQTWTLGRRSKPCASLEEGPRPERQLLQALSRLFKEEQDSHCCCGKSRIRGAAGDETRESGGQTISDPEATAGTSAFTLHEQGRERKVQSRRVTSFDGILTTIAQAVLLRIKVDQTRVGATGGGMKRSGLDAF